MNDTEGITPMRFWRWLSGTRSRRNTVALSQAAKNQASGQGWLTTRLSNGVHVIPPGDFTTHSPFDCPCGPRDELVTSNNGDGWVIVHHSLDGRENDE